jgi:hypothetical protein
MEGVLKRRGENIMWTSLLKTQQIGYMEKEVAVFAMGMCRKPSRITERRKFRRC